MFATKLIPVRHDAFPQASLLLGFRFWLSVGESDERIDDGEKRGCPFRYAKPNLGTDELT